MGWWRHWRYGGGDRHGVVTLLVCFCLLQVAAGKTFPRDAAALRQLKAALDPSSLTPGSCISSWDFAAADPCDSLFSAASFTCGFRCDAVDSAGFSRVTDVALDSAGYSGKLSPAIWSLPYLQTLDLPDNELHGSVPLPPRGGGAVLRRLRRMTLSRNAFSGKIPLSELPALEELFLDGNRFSGPIPSPPPLRSLRRLEIQMNNLSGGLPELGSMPGLLYLDASDNLLSGDLPPSLPPSLVQLSLRNNLLRGPLAGDLVEALPNMQVLDLSHNRISGELPAALFAHPALQQLTLSHNQFTALPPPPRWWWWHPAPMSSQLVAVDLGHNLLTGMLPLGMLTAMPRLTALVLEDNRLSGMIPLEYALRVVAGLVGGGAAGVAPLARLVLAGNYLCGPIPGPLTAMKEGDALVSLANNCLLSCPEIFFFCQGAAQKQPQVCHIFNPLVP
ncbi:unnamed protein product [Spirodela intermedia]|uniref:Uncharacterized protein n=2 Tax=Spirodela intermedia TaxID=51605 RepID=A0A7I8LM93_SPIIN|nr:unnamed protein product [Spirodela intermedia]CAA6673680.1 unnamed protein product [Spirodela intermedia]CAA7410920.1 unnamed protein product [Spirodela intermedia]